jgi:hypothetical protein
VLEITEFSEYNNTTKKKKDTKSMVVCAHGEVSGFCENHEMEILEKYEGDLEDYKGKCPVVVTGQRMTREEYESLKCVLFGRGYELVSVDWADDAIILALLRQTVERRKKRGGRQIFGFYKKNGVIAEIPEVVAVARKVIELRDKGWTMRDIKEHGEVRHPDGGELGISTIESIIKNRDKYERK